MLAAALCLPIATASAYELDAANLRLAAASMSPNFDYPAWARAQIKQSEPAIWTLLQDDPGAMRTAVETRVAALREEVAGFDSKQSFVVGKITRVRGYDPQLGGFAIMPALSRSLMAVRNLSPFEDAPWPDSFIVLTSNFDQLSVWPVHSGERTPGRVYVESEIRLMAYQHNRFFQAAVLKTTVYPSPQKRRVLFEQAEPRAPEKVISDSLLADGITLHRAPIHSYSLLGERLLEALFEREMRTAECKALARLKGHRQLYCSADWPLLPGTTLKIGRRYVGGRLVELEFFTREKPDSNAIGNIRFQVQRDVALPADADTSKPTTWHRHATEFRFDPQALADSAPGRVFLSARPDAFFKTDLSPVP